MNNQGWSILAGVALGFVIGSQVTSLWYENQIAETEKEIAATVEELRIKNAEQQSKATDTILLAQDEYRALASERDTLVERLRNQQSASHRTPERNTEAALRKRVADLEKLVGELSQAAAKCDSGWQRCATKLDALIDAIGK